ncbi:hypothetical protein CRD_01530 [Raphidiopsis brookii D9]|nr:hypothetical protein CRD_01530 [Raphidiopsis brookii D9]
MNEIEFPFLLASLTGKWQRFCLQFLLFLVCLLIIATSINIDTALAGSKDDRYEGNIFVVFAGNGSLVPPKPNPGTEFSRTQTHSTNVLY